MGLRGSKLSSANVQLQQCEKCKRSDRLKVIGKLSFCTNCILDRVNLMNKSVFRGKFEGTIDVAIRDIRKRQIRKIKIIVESETLSVVIHPNIVRYYAREQDDDYWYV